MSDTSPLAAAVETRRGSLTHGGRTRRYITVTGRVRSRKPAVLLMLHGTLQTAANIRPFAGYCFDRLAAEKNVVVIYPDAIRREWNGARAAVMMTRNNKSVDDVGFLAALITHALSTHDAAPDRVYVAGFSLGGQMSIRLIHEIPELLAGAAVLSANVPVADNLTVDRDAELALPVITIHGTRDPLAPYLGGNLNWHGCFSKGDHLSAADTASYFAARNGIDTPPVVTQAAHHPDPGSPTSVTRADYTAAGTAPVRFYTVHGGGHVLHNPDHAPAPWFWGPTTHDLCVANAVAEFFGLNTANPASEGDPR